MAAQNLCAVSNAKWEEIARLSEDSLLPRLNENEQECRKYFSKTISLTNQRLEGILTLLKSILSDSGKNQAKRRHVVPLFILLGEHESGLQPWSSAKSEQRVIEILQELYRIFNLETNLDGPLSPFFLKDFQSAGSPGKTVFGQILKCFREKLVGKNEIWRHFPAAKHSFQWMIFQVKYPHLSENIPGVLQPVLNFYDDFEVENQLNGIHCISHITANVNKSDLRAGSWGGVIHNDLKKSLFFDKDTNVIDKVLLELLNILRVIEKDPHLHSSEFTLYDETLESVLQTLEFGTDTPSKRVWIKHLISFLEVMGHATLHWIDRIIRILLDNTVCNDPVRYLLILKCTRVCIVNTWLKPNSKAFAEIILRIVFNISVFELENCDEKSRDEIFSCAIECLNLLKSNTDFETVRGQLDSITASGTHFHPKFHEAWKLLYKADITTGTEESTTSTN